MNFWGNEVVIGVQNEKIGGRPWFCSKKVKQQSRSKGVA
jgi:hypothetical protein